MHISSSIRIKCQLWTWRWPEIGRNLQLYTTNRIWFFLDRYWYNFWHSIFHSRQQQFYRFDFTSDYHNDVCTARTEEPFLNKEGKAPGCFADELPTNASPLACQSSETKQSINFNQSETKLTPTTQDNEQTPSSPLILRKSVQGSNLDWTINITIQKRQNNDMVGFDV